HKKEKSLKELSEELGVSERTVRYELEKISELLSENSLDNIEISKGIVKISNFKSLEEF
ncbi:MAG: HTH domain-containing protein, partial [Cetobacterium sp.]